MTSMSMVHVETLFGDEFVDMQTHLCTLTVPSLECAHAMIGRETLDGRTPLVLQPRRNLWSWYMNVPEGFYALLYRSGEYKGVLSPGFHWLSPLHRIQYLVTKQWTVFDAPIKKCPTKNNVMVDINTIIVFRITEAGVKDFVVTLGAEGLGAMFVDALQESVRILARTKDLRDVYSLSGHSAEGFLERVNAQFNRFGVEIKNVTITGVAIPPEHAKRLEDVSWYPTRQREQQEATEFQQMKLDQEKALNEKRDQCTNERKVMVEKNKLQLAEADREVKSVVNQTNSDVAQLQAQLQAELVDMRAKASATKQNLLAEQMKSDETSKAAIYKEQQRIDAEIEKIRQQMTSDAEYRIETLNSEREAYTRKIISSAQFLQSELVSKALSLQADAEKSISKNVSAKRKHEIDLKKLEILRDIAENPKLFITAENGMLTKQDGIPMGGPMHEVQKGAVYEAMMLQSYKSLAKSLANTSNGERALMDALGTASGSAKA
eukprot:TRINITY_DN19615_c0_g1::TRINITY_DN19615_c0_g1_i1::g.24547::m.24547 TRINITY_DN19615_c0_g1::TRINITY_DN19615_c0_g1_i1::g.24547  ORF type:complete len:491 (+),score=124.00,Band_7/PF01145.20/3.7e-19,Band_7/PF01145.20/1.5e+04,Band_7_1/PF13421.1/2.2e+03,Band_7_1/PF13421.1/1,Band_7_1/PF13421.1/6.4e+02,Band_7_1/PF13421.1/1.3e+03,DUF3595/PF12166.3/4.8 TRINITY_DN19615_c0_g1_i1:96-1568(+)